MKKGDRVRFNGRTGKVVRFLPQGMVDVDFDGSIERRSKKDLAKTNPKETAWTDYAAGAAVGALLLTGFVLLLPRRK